MSDEGSPMGGRTRAPLRLVDAPYSRPSLVVRAAVDHGAVRAGADRCVVIAAPHTSNWDFPVTMAMAEVKQVPIRWLGKAQMFNPVLGPLFRAMGGISVERSSSQGLVGDLAAELG